MVTGVLLVLALVVTGACSPRLVPTPVPGPAAGTTQARPLPGGGRPPARTPVRCSPPPTSEATPWPILPQTKPQDGDKGRRLLPKRLRRGRCLPPTRRGASWPGGALNSKRGNPVSGWPTGSGGPAAGPLSGLGSPKGPCPRLLAGPLAGHAAAGGGVLPPRACGELPGSGFLLEDSGFVGPVGVRRRLPEVGPKRLVRRGLGGRRLPPGLRRRPIRCRARPRGHDADPLQCPTGAPAPTAMGCLNGWRERGVFVAVRSAGQGHGTPPGQALAANLELAPPGR